MGAVTLQLPCPNNVNGVTLDPKPNWSMDDLISELNSLEFKLTASSTTTSAAVFPKLHSRESTSNTAVEIIGSRRRRRSSSKSFVMRISDDDTQSDEEVNDTSLVVGTRVTCRDLYLSDTDSSEDMLALHQPEGCMMDKLGLLDGFLPESEYEHHQGVKENIRNTISLLEIAVNDGDEKSISALTQVEKYTEARSEMDRKLDTQYRRKIAELLDNHLLAVQREHEQKLQIEERRIRNDAAFEEAKRKERALQEEKVRREKADAEAAKKRAEDAMIASLESERMAKEAAEKKASETAKNIAVEKAKKELNDRGDQPKEYATNNVQVAGNMIKATESALKIEAERLQKYNEIDEKNQALKSGFNQDFRSKEKHLSRLIRQITGSTDIVSKKTSELVEIINDPQCPQSINVALFAKKVISQCEAFTANSSAAFACGHVIVKVTSQVPLAMDLLLAEFHRACIYTVPKHVEKSGTTSNKAYLKMLGYREEDGKIETTEQYLNRLESCMNFYGALVQTEADGAQNLHGLMEGWAWLARLLNALPVNIYTAVALEAFLKMAGYALHRKYKSQFRKVLSHISCYFLNSLEAQRNSELNRVTMKIKTYIETNQFLKEPEGWRLQTALISSREGESNSGYYNQPHQNHQYYNQSNRWSRQY